MRLLPAIDVRAGHVAPRSAPPGLTDPIELAQKYINDGARALHLVDLDRAHGTGHNDAVLQGVMAQVPDVSWQVSGGVATPPDVARAASFGATWINVACHALGDRAAMVELTGLDISATVQWCLDVNGEHLAPRGQTMAPMRWHDAVQRICEVDPNPTLVVTHTPSDGAMTGPPLDLAARVARATCTPVICSGGVGSLDDVGAVAALGANTVAGCILGRALAAGRFSVAQALLACSSRLVGQPGSNTRTVEEP